MIDKIKKNWIKYTVFAALYYLMYRVGISFSYLDTGVSPIWPASGLALGFVLVFGWEYIFIVAVISFLMSLDLGSNSIAYSLLTASVYAFANVVKILFASSILNKIDFKRNYFSTGRVGFHFIMVVFVASGIASMIGIIPAALRMNLYLSDYLYILFNWLIGDIGGMLLITPIVIGAMTEYKMDSAKMQEAMLMYVYIAILSAFMLIQNYHELMVHIMPYMIALFLLWPVFRFSIRESSTIVAIIFVVGLLFTIYEKSIFNIEDMNDSLIAFQVYIIFLSSIVIIISGMIAENTRNYNELEILNESLEDKVKERTDALKRINTEMFKEIETRKEAEGELKNIERVLRQSEKRLKETQKIAHLGSWEYKIEDKSMIWSEEMFRILGMEYKKNLDFGEYLECIVKEDQTYFIEMIEEVIENGGTREIDIRHNRLDGTLNYSHIRAKLIMRNDRPEKIMGSIMDKTKEKLSEEKLKFYATVDEMTGLLNRRTGLLLLEKEFKMAQRAQIDLTICFIDADGLKAVNDKYGHYEGDWMIKKLSESIQESIRESDFACRLGGDEFLIALIDCDEENASIIISRIEEKIDGINAGNKKPYDIEMSYGLANYSDGREKSLDDYIKRADTMMYEDKIKNKQKKGL